MSEPEELVRLQNTRAGLEEESRSLEEQQKNLEDTAKVLEEKIAIGELENCNKAKRDSIRQLESRADELKQKLENLEMPESSNSINQVKPDPEVSSEPALQTPMHSTEAIEDEPEEAVEVAPVEDHVIAEQEDIARDFKKHNEKRKRRLF